jgi:hypothetical protein
VISASGDAESCLAFGAEATATPSQAIDPTDVPTTHLQFSFSGRANAWAYRLFSYMIY